MLLLLGFPKKQTKEDWHHARTCTHDKVDSASDAGGSDGGGAGAVLGRTLPELGCALLAAMGETESRWMNSVRPSLK